MDAKSTSRNKEIEAEQQFESTLSQEQLQVLEEENNSLIGEFERTLDQIKYLFSYTTEIDNKQRDGKSVVGNFCFAK
jgi:hypothetical protein